MPVLTEYNGDKEVERSDWNVIRMQNLPRTACRADINNFFDGLAVRKGGIVVRSLEAFVVFENHNDTRLALYRRNILLHGFKLELTIIDMEELRQSLFRIARRKLDFDHLNGVNVAKLHFQVPLRRKIRPTPVFKSDKKDHLCSPFLPEETDSPCRSHMTDGSSLDLGSRCIKRSISGIRKVNPTRVADAMEVGNNLAIFHPEECSEVKKMRIEI